MSQSVGKLLREAVQRLTQAAISDPRAAAEILLADLLGCPRYSLFLDTHRHLEANQVDCYEAWLVRRLRGEPVQYITGIQEFWSLPFRVNPHVLIPRPETELLVEYGAQAVQTWQTLYTTSPVSVLEVGVGSGCVAISLAHQLPASQVWGVDLSMQALQVAQDNARHLGVNDRMRWVRADLVTAFRRQAESFALCVSNLPYVTTAEWEALPREVRDHEPSLALLGGPDGLDVIRRLVATSSDILAPGGMLLLEVGWQQASRVVGCLQQQAAFDATGIHLDLAGIERVVWARKRC